MCYNNLRIVKYIKIFHISVYVINWGGRTQSRTPQSSSLISRKPSTASANSAFARVDAFGTSSELSKHTKL